LLGAVGISTSSEAKRRIDRGEVKLDGVKIDPHHEFSSPAELDGLILQWDKKTFRRFVVG
jgi:hypothetical protein